MYVLLFVLYIFLMDFESVNKDELKIELNIFTLASLQERDNNWLHHHSRPSVLLTKFVKAAETADGSNRV